MAEVELVIKIPEEEYSLCKEQWDTECLDTLMIAVKYGTLLPKGHGDLIDRKELLKQPMDMANYPSNYVKIAPTIIEADKGEQ